MRDHLQVAEGVCWWRNQNSHTHRLALLWELLDEGKARHRLWAKVLRLIAHHFDAKLHFTSPKGAVVILYEFAQLNLYPGHANPLMSRSPGTYQSERTGARRLGRNRAGPLAMVLTARAMVGGCYVHVLSACSRACLCGRP